MSTVLIVDDDQNGVSTFERALQLEGVEVATANSANRASEMARHAGVGLILADLRLPDRSGVDLLREVRSAGFGTPFVIMTGFGSVESAVDAMKAGADDFIEKPLLIERLLHLIRTYVGRPQFAVHASPSLRVIEAMRIIGSGYRDPQTNPRAVAATMGISVEHLSRLFKAHVGHGVHATTRNLRVAEAKTLLKCRGLSIKEITHAIGFRNVNQFEYEFRRVHRCSPTEFRRMKTAVVPRQFSMTDIKNPCN